MVDESWIKYLLILTAMISSLNCQCPAPTPVFNGGVFEVLKGQVAAHYCNSTINAFAFATNDTVIISNCLGTTWSNISTTCAVSWNSHPPPSCSASTSSPPTDTLEINTTMSISNIVKVYQCIEGLQWLSGELVRTSQCVNGSWTMILDICDKACAIPRHCADVAGLGLQGTGDFYVIPSGKPYGQIFQVYCELDNTTDNNGGNWTYIFKTNMGSFMGTMDMYLNGIFTTNYTTSLQYFIGLYYLSNVSVPLPGDPPGMTLEVLFYNSLKVVAYSTYGNFTVGDATSSYSITSLGKYHGNAGDALCPHLITPFNFANAYSADSFWWGATVTEIETTVKKNNGSFLTSSGTWKTMNYAAIPVTSIIMRIRPAMLEQDVVCPPMTGSLYWWTSSNASIPYSRAPGTNITWQCHGDYIMEGEVDGARSYQGMSTCLDTHPPQWSYNVTLPCTLNCPEGFVESEDDRVCFNYSTDTANSIMDAASKCSAKGAYLTVIVINTDFLPSDNNTSYYTAFAARGSNFNQLVPPLPAMTLDNCSSTCTPDKINQCTVIQSPNQYHHVPCFESHNYLCQLQKYCPSPAYHPLGGRCLRLFRNVTSLTSAAQACAADGASLVYPTTTAEASNITAFLIKNDSTLLSSTALTTDATTSPKTYFIGTNNFNGDWTSGGLYVMGDLLTPLSTDPVKYWRTMNVSSDHSYSFTPVDINAVIPNAGAVCSLFGPIGCSKYCPSLAANMIMLPSSFTSKDVGSVVYYQCYAGFFFSNDSSVNVLNSTCHGLLGGSTGWIPPVIPSCIPYEVCNNSTLVVQSTLLTNNSVQPESFYLNGTITFTCPPGMSFVTSATEMNSTCQVNRDMGYVFMPAVIPACDACIKEISVMNATTNWTSTSGLFVTINQTVTATCIPGYESAFGVTVQNIVCTDSGWNLTGINDCFLVCIDPAPTVLPTDNVTAPIVTDNTIGTILTYFCIEDYNFLVSENYATVTNFALVYCSSLGVWESSQTPLQCAQLCTIDPPLAPANAISDWDGFSRIIDHQVVYTADSGTLFGNYSTYWTIICNGSVWLPNDYSSTSPTGNGQMLIARKVCMFPPPDTIGGALPVNWTATSIAFVGETLNYSCPEGQFTTTGLNSTMLTCSLATANWTLPPTSFLCKIACPGPPPLAPVRATYNYTGNFTDGVVVTYHCLGGFQGGLGSTINNNCTDGNWTMYTIPRCLTVTTPKPTTTPPVILPTTDGHTYPETATLHFTNIQDFAPANNGTPGFTMVSSLVGFGYAVGLNASQSQCMVQQAFDSANQPCEANPKNCPNGFSMSVWSRVYYYANATENFEHSTSDDEQYFLSTGADGTGYPGIAIGVRKIWLFAYVSTGDKFWNVSVLGPLENNTWNNIGVSWNQTGLTVFVNSTQVGSTSKSEITTAKPGFSPTLLMVGCSKTPGSSRYYGYANADLDEVALWNSQLNTSSTVNFMGGYTSNLSAITPGDFASMVKNVLLNDPGQQAAAVSILQQMSISAASPTTTSDTVASTPSSGVTSTAATVTVDPSSVTNLRTMAQITISMLDLNKVPTNITTEQCDTFLNIAAPISNIIDPSNTEKWKQIKNQTENVGVIQTIDSFTKWQTKLVQAIFFENVTTPYCGETVLTNLYYKYCKMTIEDLGEMAKRVQLPDYTQPSLQQLRSMWKETLTDRVVFPTKLFEDDRCNSRPVTFIFNYFNTDSKSVANIGNPMNINPNALTEVDSRLMYINLVVDPPTDSTGVPDPSQPLCEIDLELLKKQTVMVKATHTTPKPQLLKLRKLLGIFSNVSKSNIEQRMCVFWNGNLTDYGAWDSSGCVLASTNAESSKCACSNFGLFSLLAIKTPPMVVHPVPAWLNAPRYIMYIISIVALSFYIIVVMVSGDLKEQFHLIGLNLAVAILVGSIAMIFSEISAVTVNRDLCTLFGTLIHLFYGAVGVWMLSLGHTSFKAITSGVIGGMLATYMLLCWGLAIAFVGIPFIWLMTDIGSDPRCFIGWPNEVKAVFFVLQMTYVIIALFFAFVVFCNLSTPALRKDNLIEDYCSFCRGAALLIIYLSVTWIFGMFTYMRFPFLQVDFYPLFQVLNSLSGVCLFVFIGIGSNRFRSVLARKSNERHEKLRNFAFGYPDDIKPRIDYGRAGNTASTSNLVSSGTYHKEN